MVQLAKKELSKLSAVGMAVLSHFKNSPRSPKLANIIHSPSLSPKTGEAVVHPFEDLCSVRRWLRDVVPSSVMYDNHQ